MSERTAPRASGGQGSTGDSTPAVSDSPSRVPLTERISAGLSNAATEHQANAAAGTGKQGRRTTKAPAKSPRRARLRLTRIDPWSVMKTSFLLSVAFGVVTFVAVFMVWSVLGAAASLLVLSAVTYSLALRLSGK